MPLPFDPEADYAIEQLAHGTRLATLEDCEDDDEPDLDDDEDEARADSLRYAMTDAERYGRP